MELACQGRSDLFFSYDKNDKAAARSLCAVCPFQLVCLSRALRLGEQHGIWGGVDLSDQAARRAAIRSLEHLISPMPRRRSLRATRTGGGAAA